ncbi:hypothetical protein C8J57DRAFT_1276943 [Mycena rebaudengoi]|nr:hypothetical protein C8J57DRAFT_1276943 [Mycena rebaudengoi]
MIEVTKSIRTSDEVTLSSGTVVHSNRTPRNWLLSAAIFISTCIALLEVSDLAIAPEFGTSSTLPLVVVVWSTVTIAVLAVLVHVSRLSGSDRMLGRTTTHIFALGGLGVSWQSLVVAMPFHTNKEACSFDSAGRSYNNKVANCALFTTSHVLAWFLWITLFSAAFAIYRRAVSIHGKAMVPRPGVVAAWRLSDISEEEAYTKA